MKKFELGRLMCTVILGTSFLAGSAYAEENLSEFVLDGINVTALGYEKSNLDTPADTVVYTGEQLKETGASDVANALKYKGGVYFTNMGPHDQNWITGSSQINLRGIDGGTLVLINGVPASFNNVNHLDMLNLDEVERVEIVKGGGAVLYGSEALGGVINIITKDKMKNSLRVAAGNKGQRDYAATIGMGKASLALGRNEFGSTGNMTEKIGDLTINSPAKTGYYIGFGDSKKDHLAFNYKFDDRFKFSYMFNKKKYSINYNDIDEMLLKHFMYDDREHFAQIAYGFTEPVVLKTKPQRVVSLVHTPVLALHEMGIRQVAVPQAAMLEWPSDLVKEAKLLNVSMNSNFDIESVIALEPDLVIVGYQSKDTYGKILDREKIPVYYVDAGHVVSYESIKELTDVLINAFWQR